MANNTEEIAHGLRSYVMQNFPETYSNVGSNLEPYTALSLMGLQGTSYWKREVVDKGKESSYKSA